MVMKKIALLLFAFGASLASAIESSDAAALRVSIMFESVETHNLSLL